MKFIFVFILLVITNEIVVSQKLKPSKINQLRITDTILINNINYVLKNEINSKSNSNSFKKGYGYISVHLKTYSEGDTIRKFYISPQLYSYKKKVSNSLYPDYYSYVNKRLVLIYLDDLKSFSMINFSKKSKRKIRKIINSTLKKPKSATFYDMNGKKVFKDKRFRIDWFKPDSGLTVTILRNGKAIIVPDRNF